MWTYFISSRRMALEEKSRLQLNARSTRLAPSFHFSPPTKLTKRQKIMSDFGSGSISVDHLNVCDPKGFKS